MRFQLRSSRWPSAGTQPKPPSMNTILSSRKVLEHAFHDQAGHLRLAGAGVLGHLLDVERRPAGIADGAPAVAEHMDADRQTRFACGFVDRPVAAAAHQLAGAGEHQHLGKAAVAGAAADFLARSIRVLVRHDQRRLEPRVARVPAIDLELVGGESQRRAVVIVLLALPRRRQRVHQGIVDAIEIEVLLAHELVIARRQAAVRRPRIAARSQRLPLGVRKALDVAVVRARTVGLRVIPPAIAEIGPQILERAFRMDVAVDDLQLCVLALRSICLASMFMAHPPSAPRRAIFIRSFAAAQAFYCHCGQCSADGAPQNAG